MAMNIIGRSSGANVQLLPQEENIHTRLPVELILECFDWLNFKELVIACLVCRSWQIIANTDQLWKKYCPPNPLKRSHSWQEEVKIPAQFIDRLPTLQRKGIFVRLNWQDPKTSFNLKEDWSRNSTCVRLSSNCFIIISFRESKNVATAFYLIGRQQKRICQITSNWVVYSNYFGSEKQWEKSLTLHVQNKKKTHSLQYSPKNPDLCPFYFCNLKTSVFEKSLIMREGDKLFFIPDFTLPEEKREKTFIYESFLIDGFCHNNKYVFVSFLLKKFIIIFSLQTKKITRLLNIGENFRLMKLFETACGDFYCFVLTYSGVLVVANGETGKEVFRKKIACKRRSYNEDFAIDPFANQIYYAKMSGYFTPPKTLKVIDFTPLDTPPSSPFERVSKRRKREQKELFQ